MKWQKKTQINIPKKSKMLCNWLKYAAPNHRVWCDTTSSESDKSVHYKCRWHRTNRNIDIELDRAWYTKLMNFQFDSFGRFTFLEPFMDERGQWPQKQQTIFRRKQKSKLTHTNTQAKMFIAHHAFQPRPFLQNTQTKTSTTFRLVANWMENKFIGHEMNLINHLILIRVDIK